MCDRSGASAQKSEDTVVWRGGAFTLYFSRSPSFPLHLSVDTKNQEMHHLPKIIKTETSLRICGRKL